MGLLVWVATLPATARATSLVYMDEPTLAARAHWIVRGAVLASESAYRDGAIPVFTDVSLQVLEVLKGELAEPVLHLALPGGDMDGRRYAVAGAPRLGAGDEVVVFLVALPSGERTLLGFSQGSYHLLPDPATGQTMAVRSTEGALLVEPARPGTAASALRVEPRASQPWPELRGRLLGYLAHPGGDATR